MFVLHKYLSFLNADFWPPKIVQNCPKFGKLTVNVIDFEEKFDFVIWTLTGKLVHGINEFLQWNASIVVFVENVKYPFNKKWLKKKKNRMHRNFFFSWEKKIVKSKSCSEIITVTVYFSLVKYFHFAKPLLFEMNGIWSFCFDLFSRKIRFDVNLVYKNPIKNFEGGGGSNSDWKSENNLIAAKNAKVDLTEKT